MRRLTVAFCIFISRIENIFYAYLKNNEHFIAKRRCFYKINRNTLLLPSLLINFQAKTISFYYKSKFQARNESNKHKFFILFYLNGETLDVFDVSEKKETPSWESFTSNLPMNKCCLLFTHFDYISVTDGVERLEVNDSQLGVSFFSVTSKTSNVSPFK